MELPIRHKPTCVLVTGGAGFIGSNFLLRMVPRYADVRFVNLDSLTYAGNLMNLTSIEDAPNYTFIHGDVADAELLLDLFRRHSFSTVVHFAAESHVDRSIMAPVGFLRTNTLGTVNLLEAARSTWNEADPRQSKYRFYQISTDEVFGSLEKDGLFDEKSPYDPRSPYSASKAAGDHFVRAYSHTYGLPSVISNCSNNYGPYQFPEKLIPLAIVRAAAGESVPIYGRGENVRDWLYVEDHCEAIDLVLHRGQTRHTYLIGGQSALSNLQVVELLLDIVDEVLGREVGRSRDLISFVKDRPGHDYRYAVDFRRIREELGWKPNHTLADGLRTTVAWYLSNQAWLDAVLDESYRAYYERQYAVR